MYARKARAGTAALILNCDTKKVRSMPHAPTVLASGKGSPARFRACVDVIQDKNVHALVGI